MPSQKLLPLAAIDRPAEVMCCELRCEPLVRFLADGELPSRMTRKPLLHYLFQERRQWNCPESHFFASVPLLLTNDHGIRDKIEVVNTRPDHFTSSCPRVGAKAKHDVNESVPRSLPGEFEQFCDLRQSEKD
jgi:hypothetical protein